MRILIAEDERITRTTLARQLQAWGHAVTSAEDGQQAWEQFTADVQFDMVITDWEMPRVSGLELVRKIRETPRELYTYVIMLTSRSEKADIVSGIEAGADDFVSKPFDREELRVRLLAGERVVRLERALTRQNAELRDANERIHTGLRAAARVQQSMLPRGNVITPHVRTAWKYVPTDEVAGDAVGLYLVDERYLIAYVLDVSGHGVPAALLSVSAMHALEPEPAETSLVRNLTGTDHGLGTVQHPARTAAELNRRFRAGEHDGRYLTMVLCALDTHTGRLHTTSAGHPPLLAFRGDRQLEVPNAGGFPIAIMDAADYEEGEMTLEPGDRLYLYSDGLLEQRQSRDEQFGSARLLQAFADRTGGALDDVVTHVVDELTRWAEGATFEDDVSIVAVEWTGAP
jgi:sigma-B regulation protein RsbU (phosphoserine phosphatase)